MVCAQGATRQRLGQGPVLGEARLAGRHHDRARARRATRYPGDRVGPGPHPRLLLEVGRRLARLPGRLRLRLLVVPRSRSGTPATAARCAGRGRTHDAAAAACRWSPPSTLALTACSGSTSSVRRTTRRRCCTRRPRPRPRRSRRTPPKPPPRARLLPPRVRRRRSRPRARQEAGAVHRRPHRRSRSSSGSFDKSLPVDGTPRAPARVDRLPAALRGVRRRHARGPAAEPAARPCGSPRPSSRPPRGAHWFECVAIALRDDQHLAVAPGPVEGVLDRDGRAATTTPSAAPPSPAPPASSSASAPRRTAGRRCAPSASSPAPTRAWTRSGRPASSPARTPARDASQRPAQLPLVLPVADPAAVARRPDLRRLLGAELTVDADASRQVRAESRQSDSRHRTTGAQNPSLRSCLGSRCQSLAIFTWRSR